jgi:hypothetical protein
LRDDVPVSASVRGWSIHAAIVAIVEIGEIVALVFIVEKTVADLWFEPVPVKMTCPQGSRN